LAAFHTALGAHLSELRAEQASADRRTHSRLSELQGVLETLVERLASIESELAGDVDDELRPPADALNSGPVAGSALPGVAALGPEVAERAAQARAGMSSEDHSFPPASGEDFLIEPGAGAPQRAREARDLAQMIGPKTNPAVSVHIAAARRAAQAALAESDGAAASGRGFGATRPEQAPLAARGVQQAEICRAPTIGCEQCRQKDNQNRRPVTPTYVDSAPGERDQGNPGSHPTKTTQQGVEQLAYGAFSNNARIKVNGRLGQWSGYQADSERRHPHRERDDSVRAGR